MKRAFTLLLCLACLTALTPAGAATMIGDGSAAQTGLAVPYAYTASSASGTAGRVLDGDARTCYAFSAWNGTYRADTPDLTFYFSNETIAAVWMRAGDYSGSASYSRNAFPSRIRLRVVRNAGSASDFNYLMDDVYDTGSAREGWAGGYQRMALPYAVSGVQRIEVYVTDWRRGSASADNVCISDILFARTSGSISGSILPPSPYDGNGGGYGGNGGSDSYSGRGRRTTLTMRLATRSGPSTNYDELGSYFQAGTAITVLSKAWDSRNGIWWVQVEFTYGGQKRRAYTGLKRVNLTAEQLPTESAIGTAWVTRTATVYYGPGPAYTAHKNSLSYGVSGTVCAVENNYVQLEFLENGRYRRVWIDRGSVNMY